MDRRINSSAVRVSALSKVVIITTPDVNCPSWPIFLAMTKLLTVVDDPSMIRIATSFSVVKPIWTAIGRKMIPYPHSFIATLTAVVPGLENACFSWMEPPMAISPSGVARTDRFSIVFSMITGWGSLRSDHAVPAAIPKMIGFVMIPFAVFLISFPSSFPLSGLNSERTTTAIALYIGTQAMTIREVSSVVP